MPVDRMKSVCRAIKNGFTLVELLVVIAIIGILMGLLLPAVGAVRETARRTQCKNNLYQFGKAMQGHVALTGFYPSGGWGWMWTGDPDRGYGAPQPGGWIYNILPFLGLDMIHNSGQGLPLDGPAPNNKPTALGAAVEAQMPNFLCPTRRKAVAYPNPASQTARNAVYTATLNKTDYAANSGTSGMLGDGPTSTDCYRTYPVCDFDPNFQRDSNALSDHNAQLTTINGVSSMLTEVRPAQITDGASNTFFAGEKYLAPDNYYNGNDAADNNSNLIGCDWDLNRWGNTTCLPFRDTKGFESQGGSYRFGSAHSVGLHFVFCDEHVRMLSFTIDPTVYQSLCQRNYAAATGNAINENY